MTLLLTALHAGPAATVLLLAAPAPSIFGSPILLMVLLFAAMYFLFMRPQQTRQKKWQAMLSQLKPGDRITTNGGIRGTILSIKEDVLQIRVAPDNVRLEVAKGAIASVITQDEGTK